MDDAVTPPTPGGYRTPTSSYDVHITDKLNMHPKIPSSTDVSFPTKTLKQDKLPSLSAVPNLQVMQAVTHIDSHRTQVTTVITKVMIFSISGDPMYLIEYTIKQNHQANISSPQKPSDPKMFFIKITIWTLHTNSAPKTPTITIGFGTHCHTPANTTV